MDAFFERLSKLLKHFTLWVIMAPWEQGVRVRLGKHVRLLKAGIHWRIPFVDEVYIQSIRLKTVNLSIQTATTRDGKIVTIGTAYSYKVIDSLKLYNTLQRPENTIANIVLGLIANRILKSNFDEIEPSSLGEEVGAEINAEQYGLGSFEVFVTDFACAKALRLLTEKSSWETYGDDFELGHNKK